MNKLQTKSYSRSELQPALAGQDIEALAQIRAAALNESPDALVRGLMGGDRTFTTPDVLYALGHFALRGDAALRASALAEARNLCASLTPHWPPRSPILCRWLAAVEQPTSDPTLDRIFRGLYDGVEPREVWDSVAEDREMLPLLAAFWPAEMWQASYELISSSDDAFVGAALLALTYPVTSLTAPRVLCLQQWITSDAVAFACPDISAWLGR